MSRSIIFGFLLLFSSYPLAAQSETLGPKTTPQQQFVAALTGVTPAMGETRLRSRWTAAERATSRQCMQRYFADLGIIMQEQAYTMPNVHAFQDLLLGPFRGANLYGVLPASSPSKAYILLGAHYDTERFAPGANDNASAIAVIYGIVKNLVATTTRDKNLLIVFFDQEEEDVVGSRSFIDFLKKKDWQINSVHTIDQLGWDKDEDRAIELELPDKSLVEYYQRAGHKLGIPIHVTSLNGSDHQAFRAAGFVVAGITEELVNGDTSPFKDSAKDTYDTVDFSYVESSTQLLTEVMKKLLGSSE